MPALLNIIIGPMFSGKSSELIRQVKRARIANKKVLVLKPDKDTRTDSKIQSHDGLTIDCVNTDYSLMDIPYIDDEIDLIAIDEAQFFHDLYKFTKFYLSNGKEIIVAGLDGDYRRKKFGEILDLIPLSNKVTKLSAICNVCGKEAHFTFRKSDEEAQIIIGEYDKYEARCWKHWEEGMKRHYLNKGMLI
ncbi:MAG: thymidine kinase [bacterium]